MAVAPVLERRVDTDESYSRELFRDVFRNADEKHNSSIGINYANLINPELTIGEVFDRNPLAMQAEQNTVAPAPVQEDEVKPESIYLVENARADSDIFRADSAVNRVAEQPVVDTSAVVDTSSEDLQEEEDNEDLRPTPTTIQYQTRGVKKSYEEGKISTSARTQRTGLTKKDKIVIAVALTILVALFVLIIVNSAVIAGLSNEVSALQGNLTEVEKVFTETLSEKQAYIDEPNMLQVVTDFATKSGMTLK